MGIREHNLIGVGGDFDVPGDLTIGGTVTGSGASSVIVNQTTHGFSVLDVLYNDGPNWIKAQSNDADTLATAVVVNVIDSDNFQVAFSGRYEIISHGLTVGEFYYTSDSTAGDITSTKPTSYFVNPIIFIDTSNTIIVLQFRAGKTKPSVSGGKYPFVNEHPDLSNTIIVAKDGGDTNTIEDGITKASVLSPSSSNPVSVFVYPGVYSENNPISIPSWVSLVSVGGTKTTHIVAQNANQNVVEGNTNSSINGFSIEGASTSGFAGVLHNTAGDTFTIVDLEIFDCDIGLKISGSNVVCYGTTIQCIKLSGETLSKSIVVDGGAFCEVEVFSSKGSSSEIISHGINISGNDTSLDIATYRASYNDISVYTNNNCKLNIESSFVDQSQSAAIQIDTTGDPFLTIASMEIQNSQDKDVEFLGTNGKLRFLSGELDFTKSIIPANSEGDIITSAVSPTAKTVAHKISGELHVGQYRQGFEAIFGEGDSRVEDMSVKTNTNGEVGTWNDVTTEASEADSSGFDLFPGVGVNNTCYVGGDEKFPNIDIEVLSVINLGSGEIIFELWDGSSWQEFNHMSTDSDFPYNQYADDAFSRVQSDQIRFGIESDTTWEKKTLDSVNKYWIRIRIDSAITTSPNLDEIKLGPNRLEIDKGGFIEYFGRARPERLIISSYALFAPNKGNKPGKKPVDFSPNISIKEYFNQFSKNSIDKAVSIFNVPDGLDTSLPLNIEISWYPYSNDSGDVELETITSSVKVGGLVNGTASETTNSVIETVPSSSSNKFFLSKLQANINKLIPGELFAIAVLRDATGGNSDDTYDDHVIILDVNVKGKFWK